MNMRHAKFCHDDPYNRSLNSDCTNATYQFLKRSRISFVSLFESRPFARFLELRVIQSLLAKGPRKRVNLFRWNCDFFDGKLNRSIGHPRTNPSLSFRTLLSLVSFFHLFDDESFANFHYHFHYSAIQWKQDFLN